MKLHNSTLWALLCLALLALLGVAAAASGGLEARAAHLQITSNGTGMAGPTYDDGFDALPKGLQAVSYSTLAMSGKVHPFKPDQTDQPSTWKSPFAPLLNITWGPENDTSHSTQGEPAAGIHPTNPLHAIVSGNFSIDTTTDGGNTWVHQNPPNPSNAGDVVNGWLEGGPGPTGANALELALSLTSGFDYTCGRSTDYGVTWATDIGCGTSVSTSYSDDREYIWVDHNPASPFYGRVYVTTALFDQAGSGSFNTVSLRRSTDNGSTWSPPRDNPLALVPNDEYAMGVAHNEFPSLGISYNGNLGLAWRRGICCGSNPTIGTNDKVMFARSTDGGATFPFSTTIVTVPQNQSVVFNSTSPLGVRWSDMPNIAADPSSTANGTFYAIWTQYRTASSAASAAIYLSRTTDNGATWSTPVIPYNNSNGSIFQGWGWVKVTDDHTIHLTYLGGTSSNTAVAQFYVQSTDNGATWSAPFQLSGSSFGAFGITTDYEANDVTYGSGASAILATWSANHHFARIGTFVQGTPTPTVTGTPPTATRTGTSTPTVTPTSTPTCGPSAPYRILIAYADREGQPTMLRNQLLAEPGVGTVDYFDAYLDTPTLAQLTQYDEVVAFSSNAWAYPFGMGNVLADYEDLGGVVVVIDYSFDNRGQWLLAGRWMTDGYTPFNPTSVTAFTNASLGEALAEHPLLQGVGSLSASGRSGVTLATGATQVATYTDSLPLVAVKSNNGHIGVAINAYLGYENMYSGDWGRLIVNAIRWLVPPRLCTTATVSTTALSTNTPTTIPTTPTVAPSTSPTNQRTNTPTPIATHTPTNTPTNVPGTTNTPQPTFTVTVTDTPGEGSPTATPQATPTSCALQFPDVPPGSTFYDFVRCLACRGVINGFPDNTFRPNNLMTRGQLSKIVSNSAGFTDPQPIQLFEDVPMGSTFQVYIGRLASRGYINGYPCGGASEPCVPPQNLPYFRPGSNATRGQISKIVSNAATFNDPPVGQTFEDVPPASTFYTFTQRLTSQSIMQGYQCGGAGEPCIPPDNRPYFRPVKNATRGQTAKIVANTFFPGCATPNRDAVTR